MDTSYWDKKKLYNEIDKLKYKLGINNNINSYPLDPLKIAKNSCQNLLIEKIPFSNSKICGILYKGNTTTTIALNKQRDIPMQNFDCMHELIHYFIHDISYCKLICSDNVIKQDTYIEWQANEGAAQFLVPYQIFIPKFLELEEQYAQSYFEDDSIDILSKIFNVTTGMIINRVNSLEHSILHYKINKQNIKDITKDLLIISNTKAKKYGLNDLKLYKLYCKNCLNVVEKDSTYCNTCGNYLLEHKIIDLNRRNGAGYLIYPKEIEVKDGKALKCPICENEDLKNGDFCKICGNIVVNRCIDEAECYTLCDGSSRYCHKCGSETTFFQNNYLDDWKKVKENLENQNEFVTIDETDDLPF